MSEVKPEFKTIGEQFRAEVAPLVNEHTRTYIVATINHNGESQVIMNGADLDFPWLLKLAEFRFSDLLRGKKK